MPKLEERLLLVNLWADPVMAKMVILDPREFEVEEYRQIYQGFQTLDPAAAGSVQVLSAWLQSQGMVKAAEEVRSIHQDSPVYADVERILYYQKTIRSQFLRRQLTHAGSLLAAKGFTAEPEFDVLLKEHLIEINRLAQMRTSVHDNTLQAIATRAEAQPERDSWPSGMFHIDMATGGMTRGEIWILNAAYKGMKTRSALNIVIAALDAPSPEAPLVPKPRSVLYVTYDGTNTDLYRSLLGVKVGLPKECFFGKFDHARYQKWIDDEADMNKSVVIAESFRVPRIFKENGGTRKLRYDYSGLMSELDVRRQLDKAKDWVATGSPLRIYDGTDPIRDLDALTALVMADKARFDTDLVIVDYVQAIASNRDYEQLAKVADTLQRMAVEQNVCVLEISQMSNDDIKHGSDGRMLATKGSGDFPATCDVGIEVWRDPEGVDPYEIRYLLKVARNAPRLVDQTWIEPWSGQWQDKWTLHSMKDHMALTKGSSNGVDPKKARGAK